MNHRTSWMLLWTFFAVGLLVGLFSEITADHLPIYIGTPIIFAGIAQRLIFYRCPHRRGSLNDVRGGIPDRCPHCGKPLE